MTVGERIKKIRQEKGLTQKELGKKCGLADSAIRRYELGGANPKIETIERIANALDVDISDLDPDHFNKILEEAKPFLQQNTRVNTMLSMLESAGYKIIQTPCLFNEGDWEIRLLDTGLQAAFNDKLCILTKGCKNYRGKMLLCNNCKNFQYEDYIIKKNDMQITITKDEMEKHINDILKYINFIFSEV